MLYEVITQRVSKAGARLFIEDRFQPVLLTRGGEGLFTAYYEPELQGSRLPIGPYQYPLFRRPPDLPPDGGYYWTREQIEAGA